MKTIAKAFQSSIDIKKSQFICRLYPAQNEKEAKKVIAEISEKYHDATHNCSAYYVSDGEGYDDNGEPSGTAGKPILNVLKKNNIENSVAIVTRYFGGIKLGAGGLVRAYSNSVLTTLNIAEIVDMELYEIYQIIFDYQNIKTIDSEIRNHKINIIKKNYEEKVNYNIALTTNDEIQAFEEKLANLVELKYLGKKYLEQIK